MISPKSDQRLDITGVVTPFSLAQCKSTLSGMPAGAILHIFLQDYDTLQDLLIIFGRSGDRIIDYAQQDNHYHLWVQKSRSSKPGEQCGPGRPGREANRHCR